jgi:arsenate reductase
MMPHYNALFLCTGNSGRSIMAEAIMNRKGRANFTAYCAGSHPGAIVHPEALKQIAAAGPVWPGQPMTAHCGVPDPAAAVGRPEEINRACRDTFSIFDRRVSLFASLDT